MRNFSGADRRRFLTTGAIAGATMALGGSNAIAEQISDPNAFRRPLSKGDVAILKFLALAEIVETDLWEQYNELGGIQDAEETDGSGNALYTTALKNLDGDMDQYIHDNTDDEKSHQNFINAYLVSKGEEPVNLDRFRTLPGSQATGAELNKRRLTNLTQLTIDTSWWTRYRAKNHNPDLDPNFVFPQAIPSLFAGQFPAIPRTDADTTDSNHLQGIAYTAAFHFAAIEQGGSSLYPALALKVTNPEVLLILLSIGPTETSHFQTWHDKAGNVKPLTDGNLVFPDLNSPPFGGQDFQTNLIMPEPVVFLDRTLPRCSVIRPVKGFGAVAAVKGLAASGLFIGQSDAFFKAAMALASAADAATRIC